MFTVTCMDTTDEEWMVITAKEQKRWYLIESGKILKKHLEAQWRQAVVAMTLKHNRDHQPMGTEELLVLMEQPIMNCW